jgi:hypothetical protein
MLNILFHMYNIDLPGGCGDPIAGLLGPASGGNEYRTVRQTVHR